MKDKRKAGRPKKVVDGCSSQQFRRISERSRKIVFNDDSFNVNLDELLFQRPPLLNIVNQNKQFHKEIDQYEEESVRNDELDEVDYDIDNNNYNMDYNLEEGNLNNVIVNDEEEEDDDDVIKRLQLILDKNLNFQNKIKNLNDMKIENLQDFIVASIIENGKLQVKATNIDDSLCGIDMIIPNTKITVGSFANSMNEFICSTNLSEDNIIKLLKIIQDHFPFSKIPLKETVYGNWKSMLSDYEQKNITILEYDVCPNGCIVYSGQYLNDWYCKNCNAKRFTNCKYCTNSFNNYSYQCSHNSRIPLKKLQSNTL
jgi:hypothetical protein